MFFNHDIFKESYIRYTYIHINICTCQEKKAGIKLLLTESKNIQIKLKKVMVEFQKITQKKRNAYTALIMSLKQTLHFVRY